jgi:hypothetical protein
LKRIFFFIAFFFISLLSFSQITDSSAVNKDSLRILPVQNYNLKISNIIYKNPFLNAKADPVSMKNIEREKPVIQDTFFYIICFLLLTLAFFKFNYARYFDNLFRVFFNTSLKQGQLVDQLLQAKLPSLFFNIFFTLTGGLFSYFLLLHYRLLRGDNAVYFIVLSVISIAIIYLTKFITLKFTGWIVHSKDVTDNYIFIIFLINKILGIFLLPIVIIMAFSKPFLVDIVVPGSLIIIFLLLILRFFRSYGILQNRLKFSRFHFLIYIIGIEILPLLLIYKTLMILLSKNV